MTVAELRERAGLSHAVTALEPAWDVTGGEVDVGAYLSGVPECMVDAVPRQVSRRGKVITFLVPGGYTNTIEHHVIIKGYYGHPRTPSMPPTCPRRSPSRTCSPT